MAGADARAVIAVEILVERNQVAPVRIALKLLGAAEDRPPPVLIARKNSCQPLRNLACDLPEIGCLTGAGRAFYLVAIAEKEMEFLQRFDKQEIYWKPDRTAPVGVAPEKTGARFRRLVIDPILHAIDFESVRVVAVIARQGADAEGRQELIFIEHVMEHAFQAIPVHQRQKPLRTFGGRSRFDVFPQAGAILDEPLHASFEARQSVDNC